MLGHHGRILAAAARAAHDEAGFAALRREDVGLFAAMGSVDPAAADLAPAVLASRPAGGAFDLARFFESGFRAIHPLWPLKMLNNVAAGQVAIDLDVRGEGLVLASDADAGTQTLGEALDAIADGVVRGALAGGVSEQLSPHSLARRRLRVPEAAAASASPLGEGGAVLALEAPGSAADRGARVLALLAGAGSAFAAGGPGDLADALERAARDALEDAGRRPADVDAVFAGGDDGAVAEALRRLLGPRARDAARVSTRGAIGDLLAGAAAADVAIAVRAIRAGALPPAAGGAPRRARPACVLVLAHGAAGGAGALVVEAAR
jgi:3-oxoacyl-(acyl-carrier-protein) synthase